VNLKEIFTIILLLEFVIINKYDEEKLLNQIKPLTINTYLNKQNFLNIEFWFENENNNYYGKLIFNNTGNQKQFSEIKELIFDINKDENVPFIFLIFLGIDKFR
jgi:hypothetical protein